LEDKELFTTFVGRWGEGRVISKVRKKKNSRDEKYVERDKG